MLTVEQVAACGVVPVVVLEDAAQAVPTARALLKGGARLGQEAVSGAAPSGKESALGGGAATQSLAFEQSARDLLKAFGVQQKLADLLGGGL